MKGSKKVKVAGIQMSCEIGNKEANIRKALKLIDQAAEENTQIILLQELFNIEYSCFCKADAEVFEYAESIPGPTTERIAEKAREHELYIISPIFEVVAPGIYYNTAPVIAPTGHIIGKYHKTHLPAAFRPGYTCLEKNYFRPGSEFPIFKTECGNLGILICYDRQFPEAWRTYMFKGAEIVFVPNALPASGAYPSDYWETLAKARAFDNQVFTVFVNRVGNEENIKFAGDSMIISPQGEILARAKDNKDTVVSATINLEEVTRVRRDHPHLRDVRTDLYSKIY